MRAADVYDCYSACTAEKSGYEALFVSAEAVAKCVCGLEDEQLISAQELYWSASRILLYETLPVIVDLSNGFGNNPQAASRIAEQLAEAGAYGLVIHDTCFQNKNQVVSMDDWRKRVRTVKAAVGNRSCKVYVAISDKSDMDERKVRSQVAAEEGCEAAQVLFRYGEACKMLLTSEETKAEVVIDMFAPEAALKGMIQFGTQTQEDKNTVFHDEHDFDGLLPGKSYYALFDFYKKWVPMEETFNSCGKVVMNKKGD